MEKLSYEAFFSQEGFGMIGESGIKGKILKIAQFATINDKKNWNRNVKSILKSLVQMGLVGFPSNWLCFRNTKLIC